jgi:nitrogenase molybdenum-iron protein NifN
MHKLIQNKSFVSTRNACKLCSPLGASIAFKGVRGCVPLIHGSQGCATYIRRYLISHYKEPVDIASTNFSEDSAVFGGERNLTQALDNITESYNPEIVGIATTCLSETIGDDIGKMIFRYKKDRLNNETLPDLVFVNSPSYMGTHADAFHNTVAELVKKYARFEATTDKVSLFPGFLSPADLRYLKEIMKDFKIDCILLPDYSNTLDNEYTGDYERIPSGGTSMEDLVNTGSSKASIEFGYILNGSGRNTLSPAELLLRKFSVPRINMGIPTGIKETDKFFEVLQDISGQEIPEKHKNDRGRLVDAYVDGHKYVFGKRAVIYGEEDFVVAMAGFLEEIGMETVLCASGGESGSLNKVIEEKVNPRTPINVHENYDFEEIAEICREIKPDLLIGNSKGYYISRELKIPLVRVGFPVHDRLGAQRLKHIGYEGTLELFDRITNALIEYTQDNSPVGYKYV